MHNLQPETAIFFIYENYDPRNESSQEIFNHKVL